MIGEIEKELRISNESTNNFQFQNLFSLKVRNFIRNEYKKYDEFYIQNYKNDNILFKFDFLEINISSELNNLKKINIQDIPKIKFYLEIDKNFEIIDVLSKFPYKLYNIEEQNPYRKLIDHLCLTIENRNDAQDLVQEINEELMVLFYNMQKDQIEDFKTIQDVIEKFGFGNDRILKNCKITEIAIHHLRQFYEDLEINVFDSIYVQEKAKKCLEHRNLFDFKLEIEESKDNNPEYYVIKSKLIEAIKRCTIRYLVCSGKAIKDRPISEFLFQDHLFQSSTDTKLFHFSKSNWIMESFDKLLEVYKIKLKHCFSLFYIINPVQLSKIKESIRFNNDREKKNEKLEKENEEEKVVDKEDKSIDIQAKPKNHKRKKGLY